MISRRTIVALLAVAVVGGVAFARWQGDSGGAADGGPLACPQCAWGGTAAPVAAGATVTWGGIQVRNRGTVDATLEAVQLVDATDGLALVEARTVVPSGHDPLVGFAREWPPAEPGGHIGVLRGHVVPPARGKEVVQLLLALRAPRNGTYDVAGVEIEYRAEGRRLRVVYPERLRLCVPVTVTHCEPPPPSRR